MSFQNCVVALLLLSDWKRKKRMPWYQKRVRCIILRENVVLELAAKFIRLRHFFNGGLKYFCISALASKMGQIIKIMAHYHAK